MSQELFGSPVRGGRGEGEREGEGIFFISAHKLRQLFKNKIFPNITCISN